MEPPSSTTPRNCNRKIRSCAQAVPYFVCRHSRSHKRVFSFVQVRLTTAGIKNFTAVVCPQERAYAPNLRLGNFAMKQAENFLNQEVKIVEGDVLNAGNRTVLAVDATIEFRIAWIRLR